jgi:predicted acylesterase/phospholipase RssA
MNGSGTHRKYRILALDGGGTFCLIQAKALANLYPGQSGHEVLSHFDMVAGCSGGSIVAAALVDGKSPAEILDLFLDRGNRMQLFSPLPVQDKLIHLGTRLLSSLGLLKAPFGPRFSTRQKLDFLHRILPHAGRMSMRQAGDYVADKVGRHIDFMIVTHDFDHNRAKMMRSRGTSPAANFPRDHGETTLAEAAHASSTAPINWFDNPAKIDTTQYWDGAMTGYNNPVLAAVTEAIASGRRAEDICVLSIGTSTVFPLRKQGSQFAESLAKVASLIVTDPPDAHNFISHVLLGGRMPDDPDECPCGDTPVIRMNPVVQKTYHADKRVFHWPEGWQKADIERLMAMDIAAVEDDDVDRVVALADQWLKDGWNNQPIRSGGELFAAQAGECDGIDPVQAAAILCEIGHHRFSAARNAWLAVSS